MAGPHHEPLVAPEPGSLDRTPISVGPSLLCFAWKPPGQKLSAPLSSGGGRGWPGHQQGKKAESTLQTVKHLAWWFLFSGLRPQECRVVLGFGRRRWLAGLVPGLLTPPPPSQ